MQWLRSLRRKRLLMDLHLYYLESAQKAKWTKFHQHLKGKWITNSLYMYNYYFYVSKLITATCSEGLWGVYFKGHKIGTRSFLSSRAVGNAAVAAKWTLDGALLPNEVGTQWRWEEESTICLLAEGFLYICDLHLCFCCDITLYSICCIKAIALCASCTIYKWTIPPIYIAFHFGQSFRSTVAD